jgi:opacity protein-like surface antigen
MLPFLKRTVFSLALLVTAATSAGAVTETACKERYYPHCNNRPYIGIDYIYSKHNYGGNLDTIFPEEFNRVNGYIGYEFAPHMGVELGYTHGFEETKNVTNAVYRSGKMEYQSIYADLVPAYHIPKLQIDILGLLGVEYQMQDAEATRVNGSVEDASEDLWGLRYGLGLRGHLTPSLSLRGMYYRVSYLDEDSDDQVQDEDTDNFMIGAQYHFSTKY